MSTSLTPRIYVACLAAYNNGRLHGAWIDANQSKEDLFTAIDDQVLKTSPELDAEEWAIHDYEDFGGINLEEGEDLETVSAYAAFIEEHGEVGAAIIGYCYSISEAQHYMEECYCGDYESEEDFTYQTAEEIMEIPEHLSYYIDFERMAADWFINDYLSINVGGRVHVFHRF